MSLFQFWKTLFCAVWMPLFFDGSTSSSSTQQTYNYDQRQVNTTNVTTDGGAIQGVIGLASQIIGTAAGSQKDAQNAAYAFTENVNGSVLDFAEGNDKRAFTAFDHAAAVQTDALHTLQSAYADAKGTTDAQQKIIFAAFAALVVVVLATKGAF